MTSSTRPTILVTGATGKTGAAVVAHLVENKWPVRAIVRSRDSRSGYLDRLGAQTIVADLYDPNQLYEAMKGTTRAYYCPPFHPHMIHSATAFAIAAQEAKLESIVGLSQWLASSSHPSLSTRQHWIVDKLFSKLPRISYTVINPGFFASYPFLAVLKCAALLGVYPMPVNGDSKNAPPSNEDIARVSAAVLMDPDRHAGKMYRPTGPKLISVAEMADILGRVLNRTVRHVKMPLWMFYKAALMDGTDKMLLSSFEYYLREQDTGAFAFGAPTNDVFELTGRQPESFETVVRRYAAKPEFQRNFSNTIGAVAAFLSVPFRPGFNPQSYRREQRFPVPTSPRFDMENEQWKFERGAQGATPKVLERSRAKVTA